jgi:hypothetical protein
MIKNNKALYFTVQKLFIYLFIPAFYFRLKGKCKFQKPKQLEIVQNS